jgi:predicted flavoprotein YhiN
MTIDLRPDASLAVLAARLAKPRGKQSLATFLRKAVQLSPADIGLLQEAAHAAKTPLAGLTPEALAALIKSLPLQLNGLAPIARAISSAGGVAFGAVDDHFMLTARPGVFVAGEMLDWEAPTGGYLLQACFATGAAAARGALSWLDNASGVETTVA